MTAVLDVLLWLLAAALLVPLGVLLAETVLALLPARRSPPPALAARPRCAVLVPAHDEEAGVGPTIRAILPQLGPHDRLVVIADNCTDRTAEVARSLGAAVLERADPARRGKGYALDFGVRGLEADPPDVAVVVDADCLVEDGALARLVGEAFVTGRPVQAAYLMDPPPGAGPRDRVSAFAFQYKNVVRPLGLWRLGLPCLLTGTGMAFPWPLLRAAALAHGDIVEDMRLGLDLAAAGRPPRFCLEARVRSELPAGRKAAAAQRTRWEHGHLRTLLTQAPRLLAAAVRLRRPDLIGLALELSVPPLSMLFLLWAAALAAVAGGWLLGGSGLPALALAGGGTAVVLAILAAWVRFGRGRLPLRSLLAAPLYVLGKAPLYAAFLLRPQRAWVRTERAAPPARSPT
jgi:cellulose synthase/poly-beta-1,6-N-acetylglucosamine synthase-like glycosyltransferase